LVPAYKPKKSQHSKKKVPENTSVPFKKLVSRDLYVCFWQGCGSGLDPDSMTLWIRIRIGNPDPGSGGQKIKKYQWKMQFLVVFFKFYH
jgi:hypothetical protein